MTTSRAEALDLVRDLPRGPMINGEWVSGGDEIQVIDPATEQPISIERSLPREGRWKWGSGDG
jgi:hypothetical protein